jgi:5,10-methylene-tetrahydrofolate dehydrogenase/methenyl tetrahydrofolate cyclohydrolase
MKKRACEEVGMHFQHVLLSGEITQAELVERVQAVNADESVHGLIVQLPLPEGIDSRAVLDAVSLAKDVDGFHPQNIGALAMKGREPQFVPCTPRGCMELLARSGVVIAGKNAVVVGRSNIVGVPMALLLLHRDATVTVCHSRTQNLQAKLADADIVVAAVGRPEMIRGEWLKEGCVVIDVGINSVEDATRARGYRLVGDVHYASAYEKASKITPVPGGVGPMTVAMLLTATFTAAQRVHQAVATE